MEIFKLPTYQNICERISCCKGQVQFSYHFTHFDISRHDSPFHVVSGQFFFAGENALPCPDVDAYSALFLRNRDLICFWQPYWPLSFLQSLQNNKQTLSEKKEGQEMSASNGTKAGCSPFKDGPKNGPSKKIYVPLYWTLQAHKKCSIIFCVCSFEGGCLKEEMAMCRGSVSRFGLAVRR